MSLSRHSSSVALTSSNRGSEKDSERLPEKSSIGEISWRISSRPEGVAGSVWRARHAGSPTSHSNDSVCRARRLGTSNGSRSLRERDPLVVPVVFFGVLVTAKMRPSKDKRDPITDMPESSRPCGSVGPGSAHSMNCCAGQGLASDERGRFLIAGSRKRAAQRGSLAAKGASVQTCPSTAVRRGGPAVLPRCDTPRTGPGIPFVHPIRKGRGPLYGRRRTNSVTPPRRSVKPTGRVVDGSPPGRGGWTAGRVSGAGRDDRGGGVAAWPPGRRLRATPLEEAAPGARRWIGR